VAYKTLYAEVNKIEFPEALEAAMELDSRLRKFDPLDPETLRSALVTLARRVKELEHEWS